MMFGYSEKRDLKACENLLAEMKNTGRKIDKLSLANYIRAIFK